LREIAKVTLDNIKEFMQGKRGTDLTNSGNLPLFNHSEQGFQSFKINVDRLFSVRRSFEHTRKGSLNFLVSSGFTPEEKLLETAQNKSVSSRTSYKKKLIHAVIKPKCHTSNLLLFLSLLQFTVLVQLLLPSSPTQRILFLTIVVGFFEEDLGSRVDRRLDLE
jgi:hypothetical protein